MRRPSSPERSAVRVAERDLPPALAKRPISRLDDTDDVAREVSVEAGVVIGADRVEQGCEFERQGLVGLDSGRGDVAAPIRQVVFTERLRISVHDAAVEYTDRLKPPRRRR